MNKLPISQCYCDDAIRDIRNISFHAYEMYDYFLFQGIVYRFIPDANVEEYEATDLVLTT